MTFFLFIDGAVAKQNDIKPITYEIQYSFQTTSYVNGPPQYTTVNRSGCWLYLIFFLKKDPLV